MQRVFVVVSAIGLVLFGCCDRETKQLQPHWLRALEHESLTPISLLKHSGTSAGVPFSISVAETTDGDPFNADVIDGFIGPQRYGFWLKLTNISGQPIRLLWSEARYVDEVGRAHTVYHYSNSVDPPNNVVDAQVPTVVSPGVLQKEIIAPGYKTYMVGSCREAYVFREPLVPTNLSDMRRFPDEASVKAYVGDLAKRQVPVKLMLPIEIEGKRHNYTFAFVLRDSRGAVSDE